MDMLARMRNRLLHFYKLLSHDYCRAALCFVLLIFLVIFLASSSIDVQEYPMIFTEGHPSQSGIWGRDSFDKPQIGYRPLTRGKVCGLEDNDGCLMHWCDKPQFGEAVPAGSSCSCHEMKRNSAHFGN